MSNSIGLICDSAQIEARILAWFAGQQDLLTGFANGEDIYSEFASELFGEPIRKANATDPKPVANYLKIKRGFGKDAILGCGYGMGAAKFYARCLENDSLRPMFDNGTYDFAFIEKLIKTYRTTYTQIIEFWTEVEKCFKWVIKYPDKVARWAVPGSPIGAGNDMLSFWKEGSTVMLQLPSGRCLRYRNCRIGNRGTIAWRYGKLWGGSLTENLVQATARDLLGYWILECEKAGLPVIHHVHDEIICLVTDFLAEEQLAEMNKIMCSVPDWADGLPLAAEGVTANSYGE